MSNYATLKNAETIDRWKATLETWADICIGFLFLILVLRSVIDWRRCN